MGWGQPSAWSPTGSGIRGRCPEPRAPHRHGGLSGGLLPAQLRECPPCPCRGSAHFFSTFFLQVLSSFCLLQTCLSGVPPAPFLSSSRSRSASAAVRRTAGVAARVTAGEGWGAARRLWRLHSGNRDFEAGRGCGEPRGHCGFPSSEQPPGCVARLSPGRGTLCVTGRVPAPLCLRFCLSGRASVNSVCLCRLAQSVLLCLSRSHLWGSGSVCLSERPNWLRLHSLSARSLARSF